MGRSASGVRRTPRGPARAARIGGTGAEPLDDAASVRSPDDGLVGRGEILAGPIRDRGRTRHAGDGYYAGQCVNSRGRGGTRFSVLGNRTDMWSPRTVGRSV